MRAGLLTGALLVLGACVPTTSYYLYNSRADVSRAHNDDFECDLAAERSVPQALRVATTPMYTTPQYTNCYKVGYTVQCNTTGGQTYGGDTYTYDANKNLRNEYYARCMVGRGWQVFEVPDCDPKKVPMDLREKLMGKLRQPAEGSCYIQLTERAGNIVYPSELLE
ncbi:hypothetical protein SAMN04487991_2158 [Celeribacter neptunius]|uniref:Lipoprotein n=1 Tax=Celeribacter neptunius TaxID=588602 RepID=A0A1I3R9W8_9RHOB|nr:hypothetical protein SAMN04487991_2158 [Celeribacter neptunius]